MLLDEVRSSLDYYRNQPGTSRLLRIVVTGGGSQLPGMTDRLASLVGVPAEAASPRDQLAIGDIGFPEHEYPRLDPYLPASVGLALGGAGTGSSSISRRARAAERRARPLRLPRVRSSRCSRSRPDSSCCSASRRISRKQSLSDKQDEKAAVVAHNEELQASIDEKADLKAQAAQVDQLDAQLTSLLATDVSWSHMLQDISKTMPGTVWLTSFQGGSRPRHRRTGAGARR